MRATDGSGALPVPPYELFSDTEVLGRMALDRMPAGLSTREPVGTRIDKAATATSKSAVSRRFVARTETALGELLAADLSGLDLVALMVDGVHFGEHLCVVALGIDIDGSRWSPSLSLGPERGLVTVVGPPTPLSPTVNAEGTQRFAATGPFTLLVQLAQEADPTDDCTVAWPEDREWVEMGVVEMTGPDTEREPAGAIPAEVDRAA